MRDLWNIFNYIIIVYIYYIYMIYIYMIWYIYDMIYTHYIYIQHMDTLCTNINYRCMEPSGLGLCLRRLSCLLLLLDLASLGRGFLCVILDRRHIGLLGLPAESLGRSWGVHENDDAKYSYSLISWWKSCFSVGYNTTWSMLIWTPDQDLSWLMKNRRFPPGSDVIY
jgi:hypothetical protein